MDCPKSALSTRPASLKRAKAGINRGQVIKKEGLKRPSKDTTTVSSLEAFLFGEVGVREERRRFPRVPASVEVRAKHSKLPVIKTRSFDVSVGGICLFLPNELPKGKVMELEMNLPVPLVIAHGEVAWTKEVETKEGKFFQTGINLSASFISANYAKMKAFVHSMMQTYQQEGGLAVLQGLCTALPISLAMWVLIIAIAWIVF